MKKSFWEDLDALYHLALTQGNLSVALKIKELQGKILFSSKSPSPGLEDLTDEMLTALIKHLEAPFIP